MLYNIQCSASNTQGRNRYAMRIRVRHKLDRVSTISVATTTVLLLTLVFTTFTTRHTQLCNSAQVLCVIPR